MTSKELKLFAKALSALMREGKYSIVQEILDEMTEGTVVSGDCNKKIDCSVYFFIAIRFYVNLNLKAILKQV